MKERVSSIKQYIQEKGEVKFLELSQIFSDISTMTLRRDLKKLEESGDVILSKGVAKSISHLSRIKEEMYSKRSMESTSEKSLIAKKALSFVEEDRSIFLDSGTTIMSFAQLLDHQKLFVITSAPNIALECVKNPNAAIHLIGGNLNRDNLSLSGLNALDFLKNVNIDTAFVAASGFSFRNGFTCGNFAECEIKKHVIEKANKVVVLMDSSKFGKSLPFTFGKLSDVDIIISDDQVPEKTANQIGIKKLK